MSSSTEKPLLAPSPPEPIGIFERFVTKAPEKLLMEHHTFRGNYFDASLSGGQRLLQVREEVFTMSQRKHVYDTNDNHLFDIRHVSSFSENTYVFVDPQGNEFLELKYAIKFFKSEATATFVCPMTGKQQSLLIAGDGTHKKADVAVVTGEARECQWAVAQMVRTGPNLFTADTYDVHVAAGVDLALMAGLCVCFDLEYRNRRAKTVQQAQIASQ